MFPSEINSPCCLGHPDRTPPETRPRGKRWHLVELGQTGFPQVRQGFQAGRGSGRSCSLEVLVRDSPIWPCSLGAGSGWVANPAWLMGAKTPVKVSYLLSPAQTVQISLFWIYRAGREKQSYNHHLASSH